LGGCYYEPADLVSIYAIGSIANGNGGSGQTVAIVDAYYNSQTLADCNAAATEWGLPTPCPLTIINQTGCVISSPSIEAAGHPNPNACTLPTSNAGWAQETDLDVQIVHGIAPNANIVLVVATSSSNANLGAGDEAAEAYSGVSVVTNSWGSNEFSGEQSNDTYISSSTVPVLFSAGDAGATTEYPCVSKYATCVGGTSLLSILSNGNAYRNVEGAWGNETWSGNADVSTQYPGGGGGCSAHVAKPAYQGTYPAVCTTRGVPDIAALADEYTGFEVYLGAFASDGSGAGFYTFGGTSLASPLTAAVIATIDADRVFNSVAIIGSDLNTLLYDAAADYNYRYYDVTTGSTTSSTATFTAVTGWDETTGLGVINAPSLAFYLLTHN
jgi:subtilase family serine protease